MSNNPLRDGKVFELRVKCTSCKKETAFKPSEFQGKSVVCPNCKTTITTIASGEYIESLFKMFD